RRGDGGGLRPADGAPCRVRTVLRPQRRVRRPGNVPLPESLGGAAGRGETQGAGSGGGLMMSEGIAIVGMACRYPDASSPRELWENVLARRRAFRQVPPERLRLEDYVGDPANPDGLYPIEAALLEGWEFDRVRFKVAGRTFRSADLAHWLALDVAAQALADAGFADAEGLPRDATGVLLGNTLTGEFSRANTLRLRWPYVRRVLAGTLAAEGWDGERIGALLGRVE